ncbi:MAG: hypothetical protein HQK53_05305 [Oligoflexia bacterium]|nr:hypothetical protein [Oligoflexia bacterium]
MKAQTPLLIVLLILMLTSVLSSALSALSPFVLVATAAEDADARKADTGKEVGIELFISLINDMPISVMEEIETKQLHHCQAHINNETIRTLYVKTVDELIQKLSYKIKPYEKISLLYVCSHGDSRFCDRCKTPVVLLGTESTAVSDCTNTILLTRTPTERCKCNDKNSISRPEHRPKYCSGYKAFKNIHRRFAADAKIIFNGCSILFGNNHEESQLKAQTIINTLGAKDALIYCNYNASTSENPESLQSPAYPWLSTPIILTEEILSQYTVPLFLKEVSLNLLFEFINNLLFDEGDQDEGNKIDPESKLIANFSNCLTLCLLLRVLDLMSAYLKLYNKYHDLQYYDIFNQGYRLRVICHHLHS